MSAPDTNLERQTRRHKPSLWGITAVLALAATFAVVAMMSEGVPADEQAAGVPAEVAATQ